MHISYRNFSNIPFCNSNGYKYKRSRLGVTVYTSAKFLRYGYESHRKLCNCVCYNDTVGGVKLKGIPSISRAKRDFAFFQKTDNLWQLFLKNENWEIFPNKDFRKTLFFLSYFFPLAPKDCVFCCFFHVYCCDYKVSVFWKNAKSRFALEIDESCFNFTIPPTHGKYVLQRFFG